MHLFASDAYIHFNVSRCRLSSVTKRAFNDCLIFGIKKNTAKFLCMLTHIHEMKLENC